MRTLLKTICVLLFFLPAGTAWAVDIEFVPVGDAGNAADSATRFGKVDLQLLLPGKSPRAVKPAAIVAAIYARFLDLLTLGQFSN
jgi:hypothetical protein